MLVYLSFFACDCLCTVKNDCVCLCVCVGMCVFVDFPQIGSDSIIGASCQVAEKTSIKRSTIGNSTTVKEKVKVTNSIIMHGVTIEEG